MATEASSPGAGTPIVPAPIATAETQHVCFICLQTDADEPNGPWVNPCPCSLEAHEKCMLQWVAETETQPSTRSSSGLRCPACRARIRIDEPRDTLIAFYNRFQRVYGRISPLVLTTIVAGGTIVGSAWYGWTALHVFAGHDAAYNWLAARTVGPWGPGRIRTPLSLVTAAVRLMELSLIGPCIVVLWWVPATGVSLIPGSLLYVGTLLARNRPFSWPPSPEWVISAMPLVRATYAVVYAEFFGPLEKRLNRILRGQPAEEPPAAQNDEAAPAQAAPAQPAEQPGEGAQPGGVGGAVANWLRHLLAPLLHGDGHAADDEDAADEHVEVEIQLELPNLGQEAEDDDDADFEDLDLAAPLEQPDPEDQNPPPQLPNGDPENPPQQQQQQNENDNNRQNPPADDGRVSFLTTLMNSMTTTLLFPGISYGMGEFIRRVVPPSWVRQPTYRRPATGLLQYRWGRSLVGACLFFVLRDAFALYYKYRRVQVKLHRKVRNVEKKAAAVAAMPGMAGPGA